MQLDIVWEPGKHVWHTKDGDVTVHVVGYFGLGMDGRHYMEVEESMTGVPLDELEKVKS